jgi:hypothetical protein
VRDSFIRPFLEGILVIGLIYCFLKTFVNWRVVNATLAVLIFSFCIEFAQYFRWADFKGLAENKIASAILGNTFDWLDLLAYLMGSLLVLITESLR